MSDKTIFKYPIDPLDDYVTVDIPQGYKILSAVNQREQLCIYAVIRMSNPKVPVKFRIAGTGHALFTNHGEDECQFIDTVMFNNGRLVFHVFEVK